MSNRDNVNIYSDVVSLFHIEYIGLFNFLTNKLTSRLCSLRSSHYACGLARMFRPRCGLRLGCGPPNLYPASRVAMNGLRLLIRYCRSMRYISTRNVPGHSLCYPAATAMRMNPAAHMICIMSISTVRLNSIRVTY